MARPIDSYGLPINSDLPLIMHVDMNSCFATIEQQANRLLRGRTVVVSPYTTPRGITVAPSIEAKLKGIRLGMRNAEVKAIDPQAVILPPDPYKYRDAHVKFKKIFQDYTDRVQPKSIDEAILDLTDSKAIKIDGRSMVDIGQEIKQRVSQDLGEWVRVNVGISTNRFLAKVAAGLHKPDGLDVITKKNLLDIYRQMDLTDLPGINVRYEARLNANGIFNPLQFFNADMRFLKKQVFQSIVGYYWFLRLRGFEIDDVETTRKSFGHNYALGQKTANKEELSRLMMKLCEKTGRRLRRDGYAASGIWIGLLYNDRTSWHRSRKVKVRMYLSQDIYRYAMRVFNEQPQSKVVTNMSIAVTELSHFQPEQLSIFDGSKSDRVAFAKHLDEINDRYGEFVITPALMAGMDKTIIDRIAFGGVKDLEDLYS